MKPGAGDRAALLLSVVLYLLLLWVGTSLLRGKGLALFLGGVVLLAFALLRFARGRRTSLYALYFLTLLGVATILAGEVVLRTSRGLVRGRVGNYVNGGYHDEPEGIYALDPHLGRAMRPGVSRLMYWNGHWWRHDANAEGYRGPVLERSAAVFLGDSLVYGHGVETDETVAARYAGLTGRPAANLGLQGACPVQSLYLLREKGLRLRPEIVFLCVHPNDLADVHYWFDPDEIRRFLADSKEQPYLPLVRRELRAPERNAWDWWLLHVAVPLRSARLLRALLHQGTAAIDGGASPPESTGPTEGPWVPRRASLEEGFEPSQAGEDVRVAWAVVRHAVERTRDLCDQAGARLVLFDLGYPYAFSTAVEELARALQVGYSPAGRVALERALAGEEVYLADDGHWSPHGNEVVAEELAKAGPRPAGDGGPAR
jgi:hypothetical protein